MIFFFPSSMKSIYGANLNISLNRSIKVSNFHDLNNSCTIAYCFTLVISLEKLALIPRKTLYENFVPMQGSSSLSWQFELVFVSKENIF